MARFAASALAVCASLVIAQTPGQESGADGAQTVPTGPIMASAPPAAPLPADAPLTLRLQARQAAIAGDLGVSAEQRRAFEVVLERLLATSRALDESAERVAAAAAARRSSGGPAQPIEVDAAFAAWQERLQDAATAVEIWPRIVRLSMEIRSQRAIELDLLAAAQVGVEDKLETEPDLVNAVPVDSLLAGLPNGSVHSRAVIALARELELRRVEIATATLAERRNAMVDRVGRLGLEREAIGNRIALAQRKQQYLQQRLEAHVHKQLDAVSAATRNVSTDAVQGAPAADFARELALLSAEVRHLLARGTEVLALADAQDQRLQELSQVWIDTRDRLAVKDASEALGLVLVSDLARSLPPRELRRLLADAQRELAGLRLRLIDLRGRLLEARDPLPGIAQGELLQRAGAAAGVDEPLLGSIHFRMLLTVEAANLAVAEALAAYETTLGELDRRNGELRDLIGKRLLWTPSHAPIGLDWWATIWQRLRAGEMPSRIGAQVGAIASTEPAGLPARAWLFAIAALCGAAWWWAARQRRHLLAQAADESRPQLRQALLVVALGTVMALPWSLLTALAFRLARGDQPPSGFYESVVRDPLPGFWTVLVLAGLILLAGARGAGGHALGWDPAQCRRLRRYAIALLALIVPSHVGVSAAWFRGDLGAIEYESRALFMLAWVGVAIVFWSALRPGGIWFGIDSGRHSLGRRLLRMGLSLASLAAAVTAAMGLQITAAAIATEVEGSIGVLATLLVIHGLALCGIAVSERRAAEWQAVAADLARKDGQAASDSAVERYADADDDAGRDSRHMVGFLIGVGGAIWLALQWADLVPALWRLDDVVLWHATTSSGGVTVQDPVSVLDLLLALSAAVLLVVGLRRLPSMADLLLRQRSSFDAGTRFAVSAVLRYAIALVGIVATLGLLGVRWSNLQWMAAALTVGLGFGLQEIFANFVSGLILLFERPVRVGDVVTVGEVTGTVANIGTRATTVVDFDRREVLIPNKALITDRLVNWTLSSEVTRITVKVGVGYDTDPELAHRLLQQAASESPLVLQRPPPQSVFTGFGASNLEFELRVFVARIDHRVAATNALNQRILALFAAAGIGIDYDQLDVRLVGNTALPPTPPAAA